MSVDPAQLALLGAVALVAALIRGFAGFGAALVYLPAAGQVLNPIEAITTLVIFELFGPLPILRPAARQCDRGDMARLSAGLLAGLPLGLLTLTMVAPEVFRYTVSLVALAMLACLVSGLRYRGPLTPALVCGTGASSGFLLGVAGIPGPPVILLYMASTRPAHVVRANTLLFLFLTQIAFVPALALIGRLEGTAVLLGALLILPNLAGSLIGARLFRPEHQRAYRWIAYGVIAAAALAGLPLWG